MPYTKYRCVKSLCLEQHTSPLCILLFLKQGLDFLTVHAKMLLLTWENIVMIDKNLIFIADRVVDHKNATFSSRDLEKLSDDYFNSMMKALAAIAPVVTHYTSPAEFMEHITEHSDQLVLSLWSGEGSRNRRALVPSICEAYGIPYVGADSYIQTICADKHLAKMFCLQYGINTTKDVVISHAGDYPMLKTLQYPVVVKPNFEGGSIGILSTNLVEDYWQATELCTKLLPHFQQLLVEEYVAGEELSVCIAGTQCLIDVFEVIRIVVDGQSYFSHELYSAEAKKAGTASVKREVISDRFPNDIRNRLLALYNGLGKVDLIRIDGRLNKNGFFVIELTPDCNLSQNSSMALAFRYAGYTHEQMLHRLCKNSLKCR